MVPAAAPALSGAASGSAAGAALPADAKAPDALRNIGEVARLLGVKTHVLRYWESQFPALRPVKLAGGRRYYRPADVALLQQIHTMVHGQGFPLAGARRQLRAAATEGAVEQPLPAAEAPPPGADAGAQAALLAGLRLLRDRLARALDG